MALNLEDDILQDFLVEAGEILEQLGEQLVQLEQQPDDRDLLNAVFRGFHTIKGGAGFINLEALVALCHRAEDVFNLLRNGDRHVDAELMDVVLPVLDVLNEQFAALRAGAEPQHADPQLLQRLEALSVPGDAPAPTPTPATPANDAAGVGGGEDITDEEFEHLLDALDKTPAEAKAGAGAGTVAAGGDDINDDEFEALLDELHGKGKFGAAAPAAPPAAAPAPGAAARGEEISEDEFEALLDELHGTGKFGAAPPASPPSPAPNARPAAAAARPKGEPAPQPESTVRVDTRRLDDIMNMVGELVLVRNRLARLEASMGDEEMGKAVDNLDLVTTNLQMAVMKTRMQPIKKVFGRFPRVVRDLARNLKKEVHLVMHGEETDLDKNLVEALADPLVHLVRNAVDHGIEMPEERERSGKPRAGTVTLSAAQEGDHILLSIEDDGAGMDAEALRRKAVDKGVLDADAAARLDASECFNLIFMPGFSTKSEISDISGRGVGMDVVKTKISQLNGTVHIDSAPGRGSRLSIKVPLTLAIMPTLMVQLADRQFALPLVNVNEIFNLEDAKTNSVDGQLVVRVRERALPLFYLSRWLIEGKAQVELPEQGYVVVVHAGTQKVGLVVDELYGQEEVVIKPLGAFLQGTGGLAGATITGDGRIAVILDVPGLMSNYAGRL